MTKKSPENIYEHLAARTSTLHAPDNDPRDLIAGYHEGKKGPKPQTEIDASLDAVSKGISLPPAPTQRQLRETEARSGVYSYGSRQNRHRPGFRSAVFATGALAVVEGVRLLTGGSSPAPKPPEAPTAMTTKVGDANYVVPKGTSLWDVAGLVDKAQDGIVGNQDKRQIVAGLSEELGTDQLQTGQNITVHGVHDQNPTIPGIQITPPEAK